MGTPSGTSHESALATKTDAKTDPSGGVSKFIAHSFTATSIAIQNGWLPGARYSNLRDIRRFERLGFLDIDWKEYNYKSHLRAAKDTRPRLTVARDIEDVGDLDRILDQARELQVYSEEVIIVPKDIRISNELEDLIPEDFLLGYSVPTRYGGTKIPTSAFKRPVHLLGGRPDVQRAFGNELSVISLDCNRFTLDAKFGDYFNGSTFRPHPIGGYKRCLLDSVVNINILWNDYTGIIDASR